jgi:hypothetical protein
MYLYYEYSIIASYNGVYNINNEIVKIFDVGYNNEVNNLLSNMKFYKDVLPCRKKIVLDNSIISDIDDNNVILTSSSSCLIKNKDNNGYKMNVRYVNYLINNSGHYLNCDKYIITANKCFELNNDLKFKKDELLEINFDGRRYIGVEDVRIYYDKYNDKLMYIGTGFHQDDKIGVVSGEYDLENKKLGINELKQHFKESGCEKNWVFVDYKNENHIVYDWYPLQICKLREDNTITITETKEMPKIFSNVRGSTCGFNYSKKIDQTANGNITVDITETEIWFVGHIVSYEQPRHYYHIIYVFDSEMNLLRYSAPFKFEGEPIEYCLSIVVEDDRVLINYSTWDRTTRIGVYDKTHIDSILKYK